MRTECRQARRELLRTKQDLQQEIAEKRHAQNQSQDLVHRLKDLEPELAKLEKWKKREPALTHYLDAFPHMVRYVDASVA